jgi:hypothetical protein
MIYKSLISLAEKWDKEAKEFAGQSDRYMSNENLYDGGVFAHKAFVLMSCANELLEITKSEMAKEKRVIEVQIQDSK